MVAREPQCEAELKLLHNFATSGSNLGPKMDEEAKKLPPQVFRCTLEEGHGGDHLTVDSSRQEVARWDRNRPT